MSLADIIAKDLNINFINNIIKWVYSNKDSTFWISIE